MDLIDIKIRKQGKLLIENQDYIIDWKEKIIKFNIKDYRYYTFSMYISINALYVNNLLKELYSLK